MPKVKKSKLNPGWILLIILLLLIDFGLFIKYFVFDKNIALFNPQGSIAQEQYSLMMFLIAVLFAIAIPSLFIAYFVAWRFRESNFKVASNSKSHQSKYLVVAMWTVPIFVMVIITSVMIPATHRLVPQKVIASDKEPMTIQVISMDWKWLFLYPEEGIATVNFVQFPEDTQVTFEMTADESPMSSFWIPNLGGQLYTMTKHVNRLNLMADNIGDYPGKSAELNGVGFSGMTFIARASSDSDFDNWVKEVKQSPDLLDSETYQNLVKPSEYNPVTYYSTYNIDTFDKVLMKYNEFDEGHMHH